MNKLKLSIAALAATFVSGCITFPTVESEKVTVVWDDVRMIENCDLIQPVYGSEGSFYDFWLHADKNMLWGTLNQMRIQTAEIGGDVMYLFRPLGFTSSVTLLGNAYACAPQAKENAKKIKAVQQAKFEAKMKAEAEKSSSK